jgi:hypothetical protein
VVDDAASDEQTQALERILSGQEGGTFGELAQLITEFLGTERGTVSFSDGETPTGAVGDKTEIRFEPNRGVDGLPTTVKTQHTGSLRNTGSVLPPVALTPSDCHLGSMLTSSSPARPKRLCAGRHESRVKRVVGSTELRARP